MLTEEWNHGILDMLKTVYPTKTLFCWGYNESFEYHFLQKFMYYEKKINSCMQCVLVNYVNFKS